MTCAFGEAELRFPETGIRVRTFNITIDADAESLTYAAAKVSKEAGRLVVTTLTETQPVEIWVGGKRLAYLALETGGVDEADDHATIRLRDPRVTLSYGVISGDYSEITLEDVVEKVVFPAIQESSNVIRDVRFTDDETAEELSVAYPGAIASFTAGVLDYLEDDANDYPYWLTHWVGVPGSAVTGENPTPEIAELLYDRITDFSADVWRPVLDFAGRSGGFFFEEVSPAEALEEIEAEFEVQSWIDDGVLWVGIPQKTAKVGVVGRQTDQLQLVDHAVLDTSLAISHVVAEAGYVTFAGEYYDSWPDEEYRARAIASLNPDLPQSGTVLMIDGNRAKSLKELEERVERRLRAEAFKRSTGTITLNSSVATNDLSLHPAKLSLGDLLLVLPQSITCGESVEGGIFGVTGFTHRISSRGGWKTTVQLGRVLDQTSVITEGFFTNPRIEGWVTKDTYYKTESSTTGGSVL